MAMAVVKDHSKTGFLELLQILCGRQPPNDRGKNQGNDNHLNQGEKKFARQCQPVADGGSIGG